MSTTAESTLASPQFTPVALGSCGMVWKLSSLIVVKIYLDRDREEVQNELSIYDYFARQNLCNQHIVQCFFHTPQLLFLEYASGGTLDDRLRRNQTRKDPPVEISKREDSVLGLQWMAELCSAIAWLEDLGYVHADIRPPNILLDGKDHLKVTDFGDTTTPGTTIIGSQPPYARILGPEAGTAAGSFGKYGPKSEQFAIGTIICRGYEPFDNQDLGKFHGREVVRRLQAMEFPHLDDHDVVDAETKKCWHGEYESVNTLSLRVTQIAHRAGSVVAEKVTPEWLSRQREECEGLEGTEKVHQLIARAVHS